jgi:hypothetical protein
MQHLLNSVREPDSRMGLDRSQLCLIPMLVKWESIHLRVMRRIVVCPNRAIRTLPVVTAMKIRRNSPLDSNHLADIQIGRVKEMDAGFDPTYDIRETVKWVIRFDLDDGSGF